MQDATVVGLPIPGLTAIDARTSEDDWVVTGSHRGERFRNYVSGNVDRDGALQAVARHRHLTASGLEWIDARRRHEVERCVRMDYMRLR